jgi:hypothetical protein
MVGYQMSGVALVQFSEVDLRKLLLLCRQSLDRGVADSADAAGCEPPLHHMLCIAAMKTPDVKANAEAVRPYMNLFHAGFIIAADERYCAEILELASMPSIMIPSIERDVSVMFISGTLSQWREAILKGCQKEVSRESRHTFNMIYTEFKNVGLAGAFSFKSKDHTRDQTFLLEYKT